MVARTRPVPVQQPVAEFGIRGRGKRGWEAGPGCGRCAGCSAAVSPERLWRAERTGVAAVALGRLTGLHVTLALPVLSGLPGVWRCCAQKRVISIPYLFISLFLRFGSENTPVWPNCGFTVVHRQRGLGRGSRASAPQDVSPCSSALKRDH